MEEINTVRHVVKLLLTINKFINKRDMIFYTTNDGQVKIEVRLEFIKKRIRFTKQNGICIFRCNRNLTQAEKDYLEIMGEDIKIILWS